MMPSNYKRLLLTTCLPAMALTLSMPLPANAGFEWTPPEKVEVAPLPQVIDVEPVIEEIIPATPAEIEPAIPLEQEPVLIAPIEEEIEMPVEMVAEQPPMPMPVIEDPVVMDSEELTETIVEEPVMEDIAIEAQEVIEEKPDTPEIVRIVPETAEEAMITIPEPKPMNVTEEAIIEIKEEPILQEESIEVTPEVILDEASSKDTEKLTIMPFPEDAEQNQASQKAIILPEDQSKDVEIITETPVVETPKEDIVWNKGETFDVLEGFGTDLPLALALRQVVPAQYAFAFDKGVNMGTKISWQGGKPWNDVLRDSLAPANLTYKLHESKVTIQKAESTMPPMINTIEEDVEEADLETTSDSSEVENVMIKEVKEEIENTADKPQEASPLDDIYRTKATSQLEEPDFLDIKPQSIDTATPDRKNIIDPGMKEATQPNAQDNLLSEPKKKH